MLPKGDGLLAPSVVGSIRWLRTRGSALGKTTTGRVESVNESLGDVRWTFADDDDSIDELVYVSWPPNHPQAEKARHVRGRRVRVNLGSEVQGLRHGESFELLDDEAPQEA